MYELENISFINTAEFSREGAQQYLKYGTYCTALAGTRDYWEYWDEQKRRCEEGHTVGGVTITGDHYFYLNFCRIIKTDKGDEVVVDQEKASRSEGFPRFWDLDYHFFWAIENARRAGKHLCIIKARGKGYSYKMGSRLSKGFSLQRNYRGYAFAWEKEFLLKDGLLQKCWDNIDFMDDNTPFYQPRLKNLDLWKRSGYKALINGQTITRGTRNEIQGITLKDNLDRGRGKRGNDIIFEEAGKLPGLPRAWKISQPSVEQGTNVFGLMIAGGTGGTEGADFEGLEEIYYHPDTYNCLVFNNVWDDGSHGNPAGLFIPSYSAYEGFMDEDGNSDERGAREYLQAKRDEIKKTGKIEALEQETAENPFNPREATLRLTTNIFPTNELLQRQNYLKSINVENMFPGGHLVRTGAGLKWVPYSANPPVHKFPTGPRDDATGCIVIIEPPYRNAEDKVPAGMYLIGHDPYAHDKSTGPSLGATYVFKRTNRLSWTYNECPVAYYVGRPPIQDEYNHNLFMLAEYYNCKIGFENDRGNVKEYAQSKRMLHLLEGEFQMLHKADLKSTSVQRPYGMHMTPQRKAQGQIYIRDWLLSPISKNGDEYRTVIDSLYDPGLIEELLKYDPDGNFDRVMAVMIAMYYMKEMEVLMIVPEEEEPEYMEFFERDWFV